MRFLIAGLFLASSLTVVSHAAEPSVESPFGAPSAPLTEEEKAAIQAEAEAIREAREKAARKAAKAAEEKRMAEEAAQRSAEAEARRIAEEKRRAEEAARAAAEAARANAPSGTGVNPALQLSPRVTPQVPAGLKPGE